MSKRYVIIEGVGTTAETAVKEVGSDAAYTVPSGKMLSVVSYFIHNQNTSPKYCKVKIGNTLLVGESQISAKATLLSESGFNAYMKAGEQITVQSEIDNDLGYRINGIEVDI
jgi:hypothetical protein